MADPTQHLQRWLRACMPHVSVSLTAACKLRYEPEREVWDCTLAIGTAQFDAVLTLFKAGSLETVNASLPTKQAAEKCFLAMSELPVLGVPTPAALGWAVASAEAAVLCERIEHMEWGSDTRVRAARLLACLHNLQDFRLSGRLRKLIRLSDPREYRTSGGRAPAAKEKRLVHGDYFSKNILRVTGGLCVIDWETLAWGDPMWDLGFLIGADPHLTDREIEAVVAEYGSSAAVDWDSLMWHRHWWSDFWRERESRSSSTTGAGHDLPHV